MNRHISLLAGIVLSVITTFSTTPTNISAKNEYVETNGFTLEEIEQSEVKPIVSISVNGKEKGTVLTKSDAGDKVVVSINVKGASKKYNYVAFHIYYSDRLTLTDNPTYKELVECTSSKDFFFSRRSSYNITVGDAFSDFDFTYGFAEYDPTAPSGMNGLFVGAWGNMGKFDDDDNLIQGTYDPYAPNGKDGVIFDIEL